MDYMKYKHDLSFGLVCPICGEKKFTKKEKINDGEDIIQTQECDSCFEISWYHLKKKQIKQEEKEYEKIMEEISEEYRQLREFFGYKHPLIEKENKMQQFVVKIIHSGLNTEDSQYFLSLLTELTMRIELEKENMIAPIQKEKDFVDLTIDLLENLKGAVNNLCDRAILLNSSVEELKKGIEWMFDEPLNNLKKDKGVKS